jgi:hypothetical protein
MRLRHRIAELESVIRTLKKNPHPRWTAPGGVVHDPAFFESYRRSTPRAIRGNSGPTSGDTIKSAASGDAKVKAETTASSTSNLNAVAKGAFHISPQAPPTCFHSMSHRVDTEGTATPSINSNSTGNSPSHQSQHEFSHNIMNLYPISNSNPLMYEPSASVNTATACNEYTADASGVGFSPPPRSHFSNHALISNFGFQTAAAASVSLTDTSQSSDQRRDPCNCLNDSMAFAPLVRLGIALRTSREVLERLHPPSSDCVLYCRIYVLEQHILWVSCFSSEHWTDI